VTDQHEGEHLEVFELQAGDLVVTDRANGLRERIAFVHKRGADLVVRFTPHNLPLEDEQGKALSVVRWLKGRHAPAGRVCSWPVWIKHGGQRIALRWIALRLSEQQRQAAQRRKKRSAGKKQQQVQPDTLYLAGWVLLVTTLPSEHWSDQQVLRLYQARWHVELGAEAHQTAAQAAERTMQDGGDCPPDDHLAVAGVGRARKRKVLPCVWPCARRCTVRSRQKRRTR
jgi:hypothetical protein